jgi:23S rRNA (uracil1939-C5)-methyltransferase
VSPRTTLDGSPRQAVVDGFTHGGEGVARVQGKAVFVPGALPGEVVRLRVVDDRKRWARAELLEVVAPSPDRVAPPCPYVPECGGCDLQHAAVPAQRRLKTRVVIEQLQRLGGVADPPVEPCREVGPATGYRAQARLRADPDGHLGFHRAGSTEVVPIDRCLILTDAAQGVRDTVGDTSGAAELAVRGIDPDGGAVATLRPGPGALQLPEGPFDLLLEQPGGELVPMRGDGHLDVEVAGLVFGVPGDAFFQPSHPAAEALVAAVREALGDVRGALVWDLYAGVGLLSLALAADGAEVVAVEGNAAAAAAATRNAARNELALTVLTEPVGEVVAGGAGGDLPLEPPDLVVLDPPRTGAGPDIIADLAGASPAMVVYVACDVAALARDTAALSAAGYRLTRAVPLDLFPMTHHVEVVASFVR